MATLKEPLGPHDNYQGDLNAPLALIEYGDYQCPYCGAAYGVIKQVQAHFGDKLCFAFRDFPLTEMHEHALGAAIVADFAAKYDQFWPVHDTLYENQKRLGLSTFYEKIAQTYQLPLPELMAEFKNPSTEEKIMHDFKTGVRSGVNGTPTFFMNGKRYQGPVEANAMIDALDTLLKA